jgi:dTDP-4-amino-4,6-dideoxygalactose transaminase
VHCAINALRLQAGDEVVTTPITDMGALTCILYEGGVPVFADVDPVTINVTAETIARQLTDRTRAIVVTHLFGLSCDMQPIVELAARRGIPVIEDMAQAFGAEERSGRPGTRGALACYSLQQGKHMTTGEGGVVTTDDPALARRVFLFVNKAWGYGDPQPDHYFPAPNFRLTEVQGAIAIAQLQKLDWVVQRRREVAAQLSAGLRSVPGLHLPQDPPGGRHSWWKYAFFVDPAVVDGGAVELGRRMKERGVFCVPRYIQKPAFECQLFADFAASPVTRLPLEHNPRRQQPQPLFHRRDYPGAVRALERVVVLPINELYGTEHVDHVTAVIREQARVLAHV